MVLVYVYSTRVWKGKGHILTVSEAGVKAQSHLSCACDVSVYQLSFSCPLALPSMTCEKSNFLFLSDNSSLEEAHWIRITAYL